MPIQHATSEPAVPAIRLRLPATSANLGPGFDSLGLALSLYLTVEATQASETHIAATGRNAEQTGSLSDNLILTTYREIFADLGLAAPPLALKLHNEIPLGMGCGSSAAALLAGVFLATHFGGLRWTPQQVLDEACRREGHPDNVAACFFGGMTASATSLTASVEPEATTVAATVGRNLKWPLYLALPQASLATAEARALLPASYSRADSVGNIQATALLVSAFALDRPELLVTAMRDRLHQPFRASVCPLLPALLPLAGRHGIQGVALSGAGPAVLLLATPSVSPLELESVIRAAASKDLAELLTVSIGEPAQISVQVR